MRNFFAFATLCLVCVLGTTSPSYAQSKTWPMGSHPIQATDWGFGCPNHNPSCGLNGKWINSRSQPGTVRLWQSGTEWAFLHIADQSYDWRHLDTWLDLVADHQPRAVIYTFGLVPCWISSAGCDGNGWGMGHNFSNSPPSDLTSSGSPSFNDFVKELTQHCSPAGHCVKDYIQYWEMWNEGNLPSFWAGTAEQLYDMFKPAISIIRKNIPGAIVSTPPVCGGDATWMTSWMTLENTNGRLSDYYGIHIYILDFAPEDRMGMLRHMLDTKNTNGWTKTPWMNTETGYDIDTFTCSSQFSRADCRGQLVRWHVLQFAYQGGGGGAFHVGWYNWPTLHGGGYDTYYHTMMKWLTGVTFTASCTNAGTVWTCPLTEASGAQALIVWDSSGRSRYKPDTRYTDYKYFNHTFGGAKKSISPGQKTRIGFAPIMFEAGN